MKIKPHNKNYDVTYPSHKEFSVGRNQQLLKICAAVGISVGAIITPSLSADEKEKNIPVCKATEKINNEIAKLVSDLGNKNYKKREHATVALIALGNAKVKDKDGKEVCNTQVKDAVVTAVKKLKKNKDPEVKQRVKRIMVALAPPKKDTAKRGGDFPRLGGIIVAPQELK